MRHLSYTVYKNRSSEVGESFEKRMSKIYGNRLIKNTNGLNFYNIDGTDVITFTPEFKTQTSFVNIFGDLTKINSKKIEIESNTKVELKERL